MKKLFAMLVAMALVGSLAACGGSTDKAESGSAAVSSAAPASSAVQEEEASSAPAAEGQGVVGEWKIGSAEVEGETYTLDELNEMLAGLEETGDVDQMGEALSGLSSLFAMQFQFDEDGTGIISFPGTDLLEGTDPSLTWENTDGDNYVMMDVSGTSSPFTYNAETDTISMESSGTMLFMVRS